MRWFATALEEEPLHRATHEALADHYTRTGNLATAKKHRQILEKIGPKP